MTVTYNYWTVVRRYSACLFLIGTSAVIFPPPPPEMLGISGVEAAADMSSFRTHVGYPIVQAETVIFNWAEILWCYHIPGMYRLRNQVSKA